MAKPYRMMRVHPDFHRLVENIRTGTNRSSVDVTKDLSGFQVNVEIRKRKRPKDRHSMFDLGL